ncbi:APC family permease [Spiroplasma taiwanense]|uniref:Putative permease n=1 Tax=Spiroplasma taiwanense CT-1 TaxID=1276220 RepID=S5MI17_9MOLU|nr:APC family permease [Spiroplasma taiwanense]AGR41535.1 putative permease [Spiroplasma taiwanense CT-1]
MNAKKEQLGLFSIIWMGFSFIAGITFTASFSTIVLGDGQGVGINILWIFLIEGVIAFMCAWAFGKLVKFHPEANGGGSQYVRTAFGKFWGLLMGLLNYSVIPVIGVALIVTMIRANFGSDPLQLVGENGKWGAWGSLYLDVIAFGLYIFAATIIFFGIKRYKYVAIIMGYLTWGITLLLMIFGLTVGFMSIADGKSNFDVYIEQAKLLNVKSFSNAFTTCFFAFAGIETFITTGKNIKNRSKNMPIAIIVILTLTTLFYIVFTVIVMMAIGGVFDPNPNSQMFTTFNSEFLKVFGPWLIILCTALMRFNSSLQITLFGATTLEPLASQHFVPSSLKKENKDNVPVKGVITTIGLFSITTLLFLFIPDIVEGVTKKPSPFNYATLASSASIILIAIYSIIIPVALVNGFKKKIKVKKWEYVGWITTLIFLAFTFVSYFIDLFNVFINPYDSDGDFNLQGVIANIFQLIYFVTIVVVLIIVYYFYYKKQIAKLDPNSQEAKELEIYEQNFRILSETEIEEIELIQNSLIKEEKKIV